MFVIQPSTNGAPVANQKTNLTAEKTNKLQPGLKSVKSSLGKALRSSKGSAVSGTGISLL